MTKTPLHALLAKPARLAVKICGISEEAGLAAALAHGAGALGFVIGAASPRRVSLERASALRALLPDFVAAGAVVRDADDALMDEIIIRLRPDFLQAHGEETPARVKALAARLPVVKALAVGGQSTGEGLHNAAQAFPAAAAILFDAAQAGSGQAFRWSLLKTFPLPRRWILSGGLTADNLAAAVAATGTELVDVSSGVESAGQKDPARIGQFCAAAGRVLAPRAAPFGFC